MQADPDIRVFRLAAGRHLRSAKVLFHAQMYADAIYLAGYTAECNLKALILANTPSSRRRATILAEFRGSRGHDLVALRNVIRIRGGNISADVNSALRSIAFWAPDLRYTAPRFTPRDAVAFITAVELIDTWAERRLI